MTQIRCLSVIFFMLPLVSACATARLTLDLDLYAEDPVPNKLELTPASVIEIHSNLNSTARTIRSFADDRRTLADELFNTYRAIVKTWLVFVKKEVLSDAELDQEDNIKALNEKLDAHKSRITELARNAEAKINDARGEIDRYEQTLSNVSSSTITSPAQKLAELKLLQAVRIASDAVTQFGGPLETEFERELMNDWSSMGRSISEENIKSATKKDASEQKRREQALSNLREQVMKLARMISALRDRGLNISNDTVNALNRAGKDIQPNPSQLSSAFSNLISTTDKVYKSLRPQDELEAIVRLTGRQFNLVDRTQDPADPVWRIISLPDNESKWRNTFTETYFYAEGNTSVVVVRDTPFSFRVQKATNNPTALVREQLRISRAVGNAAIAVASAASGAPIPRLPGTGDTSSSAPPNQDAAESKKLAEAKAMIGRQAAVRREASRNFRRDLVALRAELDRTDEKNKDAVNKVLEKVQSLLKVYAKFLEQPPT